MSLLEDAGSRSDLEAAPYLRELVESLEQIVFLISGDLNRIYYVSPAYERVLGHSSNQLYANPRAWLEMVHVDDRPMVLEMMGKRLSGELTGRSEIEYRVVNASGETRWLRSIVIPARKEKGASNERLVGVAEDITERKEEELMLKKTREELAFKVEARSQELSLTVARLQQQIEQRNEVEAELRRSEARFSRLFEAHIIGVVFSDIYGNISNANEAFLEMTGYCRDDLPLRWDKMTPPEWVHVSELAVQQLVRDGNVPPMEKEYYRKDNSRVPVLLGGTLLDRERWQAVFFVLDLTGRKNAEEQVREVSLQLEHASRLSVMGEMLADMAHEIHQPLGVITNYANGSLRRLKKGELTVGALKERLREIAGESMRVAEVLRRIREFIRRRDPERKLVNLNVIVMNALQFTRLERREHRVAVIFRPDQGLPPVQADRVQITQVLLNLLSNAVHAISDSKVELPKILISTYLDDDGFAVITVADNGPGIAEENLKRIFDRFFTTKSGGLGLGLPISRSIIESHGGELRYDSGPGESAVFRISLPAHKNVAVEADPGR